MKVLNRMSLLPTKVTKVSCVFNFGKIFYSKTEKKPLKTKVSC